jgi:hypothetical protein
MSFSMPPSTPPDDDARRRAEAAALPQRRKQDEFIAVVVALASIGGIFWWTTAANRSGFNLAGLSLNPTATPTASSLPTPSADTSRLPASPAPATNPADPYAPRRAVEEGMPPLGAIGPSSLPTAPSPAVVPFNASGGTPTAPTAPPEVSPPPATVPPAPLASPPVPKATISFADLPNDYWATPYIQELGKRGILEGAGGNFLPDKPVTRAEFAAMLQKAFFDRSPVKSAIAFKDILPSYWGLPAINEAVKLGFMNGYTDGNFRATQPIPKLQGLVAIVTGLQLQDATAVNVANLYQDSAQIPAWAMDKIAKATQSELVVNYPEPKALNPTQPLTRADAAALIYQGLVKAGKVPPIASNYVVKP